MSPDKRVHSNDYNDCIALHLFADSCFPSSFFPLNQDSRAPDPNQPPPPGRFPTVLGFFPLLGGHTKFETSFEGGGRILTLVEGAHCVLAMVEVNEAVM